MAEQEEKNQKMTNSVDNVRVGYQSAVEMWAHCGDEVWARFNVMLIAHSIIVAIGGSALLRTPRLTLLTIVVSIAGFLLCILWAIMMERAFAYQNYYLFKARELEEKGYIEPINAISQGKDFEKIEEVTGLTEGVLLSCIRKWLHKNVSAQKASYIVIGIFGTIYIILFLLAVFTDNHAMNLPEKAMPLYSFCLVCC